MHRTPEVLVALRSDRRYVTTDACRRSQVYHAVITEALTAVVRVVIDESQSPKMTYGGRTGTKLQRKSFLTRHTLPHGSVAHPTQLLPHPYPRHDDTHPQPRSMSRLADNPPYA